MKRIPFLLLVLFLGITKASSADIWVSVHGNDRNNGTQASPKATLAGALRQARELRRLKDESVKGGIHIYMQSGTYSLYEPVFIRPEDSGTKESPTVIEPVKGEKVIISGGTSLTGWQKAGHVNGLPAASKGKVWVTEVPDFNGRTADFRQLWINGKKAVRARNVADFKQMARIVNNDTENEILWVPARSVKAIMNVRHAELVLHEMWAVANLRIKSIKVQGDSAGIRFCNPESRIQFEHPWPRPMLGKGVNSAFYLTNAIELLDQPGEWYYDNATSRLYYYPREGENMKTVSAVVPALETVVQVEGTVDRPVSNIRFEGINFNYTTWMRPSEKGHVPLQAGMYMLDAYTLTPKQVRDDNNHKLDNQGWIGRPPAAVQVQGANNIAFANCNFEHLGSCGLDFVEAAQHVSVEGSIFRDIAGNGLQTGKFNDPSFESHLPYDPADSRVLCANQLIANNYFTDVTNEDWGCVAICAGFVRDVTIQHNEISYVSYTGINLGWGWTQTINCMRNNKVIANNIHHYAIHMHDVAGIYTLSAQPKTVVAENYVHDIVLSPYAHDPNHWFYLYTDEGSSFIEVKDNWCDSEKFLKNANGPGNVWANNGPMVADSIRNRAGLQPDYLYLLKK
ncbi:right-handed parallel beta-helix repeat-containing protein [uncultured Bacteroides sp.]|uniref:right-handed parallel beta-helix repeat-containing protein n=1 Tax=uncultured Bacteroides sp. TaxID=162156 RepID=UPI002AABFBE7|nr:right-handed parallel beta-helix repeat-containing protein [uncultured Bacteroides sp.]